MILLVTILLYFSIDLSEKIAIDVSIPETRDFAGGMGLMIGYWLEPDRSC